MKRNICSTEKDLKCVLCSFIVKLLSKIVKLLAAPKLVSLAAARLTVALPRISSSVVFRGSSLQSLPAYVKTKKDTDRFLHTRTD